MARAKHVITTLSYVILGVFLASTASRADHSDTHKAIGGMEIYIGVVPAQVIQGHDSANEKRMHGGIPRGYDRYHLVVAMFDQASGERVTEAQISATVSEPGLAPATKPLEPMTISEALTFGNYFAMSDQGANRISLEIRVPGKAPVTAEFTHAPGDL